MNEDLRSVAATPLLRNHQRNQSNQSQPSSVTYGFKTQKTSLPRSAQRNTEQIQSTFDSDNEKKHKNGAAVATIQTQIDESRLLRKQSDTYFFEIFNKQKKKCPIMIPDTIFVGGGSILSWYFTSAKNQVVLKKKSSHLSPVEVFKALYRQSPVSVDEDFNDRKINQYLKNEHSSGEESLTMAAGADGEGGGSTTNQRRSSLVKGSNLAASLQQFQAQTQMSRAAGGLNDYSTGGTEKQWTLKKIIKQIQTKSLNAKKIEQYDQMLPKIAYVKFQSQKSKGMKPFEFYQQLIERLGDVRMIQTYIHTRVSDQIEEQVQDIQPVNTSKTKNSSLIQSQKPEQSHIPKKLVKSKPPKIIPQGSCYYCQYTHLSNSNPPQMIVSKQQVSVDLLSKMHKDGLRILNKSLITSIEAQSKIVISFIENTTHIDVKRAYLKFLSDVQGQLYYLGISQDLLYVVKGQDQIDQESPAKNFPPALQHLPNDSYVFGGNKIYNDKSRWREAGVPRVCYGDFCDFQFADNHKFLSYRGIFVKYNQRIGKKKEFERNFSLIPDKNKIFNAKFDFTVSALIIKKVEDNFDVASQILQKHSVVRSEEPVMSQITHRTLSMTNRHSQDNKKSFDEDLYDSMKRQDSMVGDKTANQINSNDEDYGMGLGNSRKMPVFVRKKLHTDTFNQLYQKVTVCKTCFLIYSMLSEYFEEIVKATFRHSKPNQLSDSGSMHPSLTQSRWIHSQKLLQKREEKPIVFSTNKRICTLQGSPSNTAHGQRGFESKKLALQKNLSSVDIAKLKGSALFKSQSTVLKIEGFQPQQDQTNTASLTQYQSSQSQQSFFNRPQILNQTQAIFASRNEGQMNQPKMHPTATISNKFLFGLNDTSRLPQNIKFNSTSGKFTLPSTNVLVSRDGSGKPPTFLKSTQSIQQRQAPKISYKIVNAIDLKQQEMEERRQKRQIRTVIGQKVGDRLFEQILGKQRDKIKLFESKDSDQKRNQEDTGGPLGSLKNIFKRGTTTASDENRDLKGSIKTAFSSLFKRHEERFYLERAHKNKSEKRKIVNFFNEVSKDALKYDIKPRLSSLSATKLPPQQSDDVNIAGQKIGLGGLLNLKKTQSSNSAKVPLQNAGRQNSVLEEWHNYKSGNNNKEAIEEENTPLQSNENKAKRSEEESLKTDRELKSPESGKNKLLSPSSRQSLTNPLSKLLVDINSQKTIVESRRKTMLSNVVVSQQQESSMDDSLPKAANMAFQSSLQIGIMSLAQKIISQQMEYIKQEKEEFQKEKSLGRASQVSPAKSNPLSIRPSPDKSQASPPRKAENGRDDILEESDEDDQDPSRRKIKLSSVFQNSKKRRNPNITQSVFHHQNLGHIKSVPFYRISTPKAPFYSSDLVGENAPDDKYIIPIENYKTMNIDQYAELMNIDLNEVKECGVFFLHEHNSMIYKVIENSQEIASNSNINQSSSSLNLSSGTIPINNLLSHALISQNQNSSPAAQPSASLNTNKIIPQPVQPAPGLGLFAGLQSAIAATKAGTEEVTPRAPSQRQDNLLKSQSLISPPNPISKIALLSSQSRKRVFHNYIVIMDVFDSFVDKIELFERLCKQNTQPCRFILFNLPGQLYTQYNFKKTDKQPLNNSYYSNCIDLLLFYLHEKNLISCLFEPYSLIGYGSGANIALYYALQVNDTNDNLRSILLFNGFCYVDQMIKDTFSAAIENFQKFPKELLMDGISSSNESISQLGDYFYQNLIWNSEAMYQHLQKQLLKNKGKEESETRNKILMTDELSNSEVGDDVASLRSFNINQPHLPGSPDRHGRTIENYITPSALPLLDTRNKIDLCKGVLANISVQEKLRFLKIPIICIYSKMNCLIPLKHSDIIQKSSQGAEQKIPQSIYADHYPPATQLNQNNLRSPKKDTQTRSLPSQNDSTQKRKSPLQNLKQSTFQVQNPLPYNPMEKILSETHSRTTLLIEGAHDVFHESRVCLEKILKDYIEVKPPMKYFLFSSLKGAFRSNMAF